MTQSSVPRRNSSSRYSPDALHNSLYIHISFYHLDSKILLTSTRNFYFLTSTNSKLRILVACYPHHHLTIDICLSYSRHLMVATASSYFTTALHHRTSTSIQYDPHLLKFRHPTHTSKLYELGSLRIDGHLSGYFNVELIFVVKLILNDCQFKIEHPAAFESQNILRDWKF